MPHHVERDLHGASDFAEKARQYVKEARDNQRQSRVLKVCILIALIVLIMVLILVFLDSEACTSMSIC
uniref:t-SNARE coiled-coil homology domain-containing protein n=1 Tax=Caenorhabditis tropicalis TaxID=1561998 RepID=A0A1I7T781_9PELO